MDTTTKSMFAQRVAKSIGALREATAQAAWVQWSAIFTVAASRRPARSLVDPEALLLVSLALRQHEPRLWSTAVVWAQFGAAALDQWSQTLPTDSRFVLASEARDLVNTHGRALDPVIRLPQLDKYRGEAYLEPFVDALKACVEFVEGVV